MTTLSVASDLIAVTEHLHALQAAAAEARAQQRETRASLGEIAGTLARIERELADQRAERRVFFHAAAAQ
jgi:hypothetical protein